MENLRLGDWREEDMEVQLLLPDMFALGEAAVVAASAVYLQFLPDKPIVVPGGYSALGPGVPISSFFSSPDLLKFDLLSIYCSDFQPVIPCATISCS